MRRFLSVLLVLISMLALSGCLPSGSRVSLRQESGFALCVTQITESAQALSWTNAPVNATEIIPQYDLYSTENFIVSGKQQNPDLYDARYYHFTGLAYMDTNSTAVKVITEESGGPSLTSNDRTALLAITDEQITAQESIHFSKSYDMFGASYQLDFDYVIYNGIPYLTYAPTGYCRPNIFHIDGEYVFVVYITDMVTQERHFYYLDVETGELTSIFDGMDAALLENVSGYAINFSFLDKTRFIAQFTTNDFYYFDTGKGSIQNLSELVGQKLSICFFAGEDIICVKELRKLGRTVVADFWKIDTSAYSVKLLLGNIDSPLTTPFAYNRLFQKSSLNYTVFLIGDTYHIYDLVNEQDILFPAPAEAEDDYSILPSPDGRRFYLYQQGIMMDDCMLILDPDSLNAITLTVQGPIFSYQSGPMYWTCDGKLVWNLYESNFLSTEFYVFDLK